MSGRGRGGKDRNSGNDKHGRGNRDDSSKGNRDQDSPDKFDRKMKTQQRKDLAQERKRLKLIRNLEYVSNPEFLSKVAANPENYKTEAAFLARLVEQWTTISLQNKPLASQDSSQTTISTEGYLFYY